MCAAKRTHAASRLQGVFGFAWSLGSRIMASCGMERTVMLWSPYSDVSVARLGGHSASVVKVLIRDDLHQLVAMCADNVRAACR